MEDAFDDLERIDLRMGLIGKYKHQLRPAYNEAIRSPEVRRRLKEAADDLEYFCDQVERVRNR